MNRRRGRDPLFGFSLLIGEKNISNDTYKSSILCGFDTERGREGEAGPVLQGNN